MYLVSLWSIWGKRGDTRGKTGNLGFSQDLKHLLPLFPETGLSILHGKYSVKW